MNVTVIKFIFFYEQRNYVKNSPVKITLSCNSLSCCPVIKLCFKHSCIILNVCQNVLH